MRQVKSCGVIVFRREPELAFLLMRHRNRYDLPKGHLEAGETETSCALRELAEETGLHAGDIDLDDSFRFVSTYYPQYKRFGGETVEKQVVLFLGWLRGDGEITTTEHHHHEWIRWAPPHAIEAGTIDDLLHALETKDLSADGNPSA